MPEYIIESKSRKELCRLARSFRKKLQLDDQKYFPIVKVLEVLPEIFDDFSYEIVEDDELPEGVHADTDIRTGHIRIRESVYDGACAGNGRDRMTVAHEIGHFLELCVVGVKLQRNMSSAMVKAYNDPEWHAKCIAGEMMIPRHLMKDADISQIVEECGVTYDAAEYQYKQMHK